MWKHRGEADGCPSCLTDATEIPPLPLAHASFLTPNKHSASGIVTVNKLPNQFRYFAEEGMPSYFSLFIFCLLITLFSSQEVQDHYYLRVVFQLMPGQSVRRASDLLAAQCLILLLLVANLDHTVKNVTNTFTDRAVRWRINSWSQFCEELGSSKRVTFPSFFWIWSVGEEQGLRRRRLLPLGRRHPASPSLCRCTLRSQIKERIRGISPREQKLTNF